MRCRSIFGQKLILLNTFRLGASTLLWKLWLQNTDFVTFRPYYLSIGIVCRIQIAEEIGEEFMSHCRYPMGKRLLITLSTWNTIVAFMLPSKDIHFVQCLEYDAKISYGTDTRRLPFTDGSLPTPQKTSWKTGTSRRLSSMNTLQGKESFDKMNHCTLGKSGVRKVMAHCSYLDKISHVRRPITALTSVSCLSCNSIVFGGKFIQNIPNITFCGALRANIGSF